MKLIRHNFFSFTSHLFIDNEKLRVNGEEKEEKINFISCFKIRFPKLNNIQL
jgi:hypothetical protein